jgi:hypothetical protein
VVFGDQRGPQGQRGSTGPPGPIGPEGPSASFDEDQVWEVIETDSDRLAATVQEALDTSDVDELREEVESLRFDLDEAEIATSAVADDLEELCSDLEFARALSDTILSC